MNRPCLNLAPNGQHYAADGQRDQPVAGVDGEELEGPLLIKVLCEERRGDEAEPADGADNGSPVPGPRAGP